jgi:ABC-2 type transport system permease protein
MHSFRIYLRLIGIQVRSQMQYRASFIFDSLGTALVVFTTFLTLALILDRFQSIGGWTLWEVAFLMGIAETAFGVMDMLFSGFDPQNFGRQIRLGLMDQLMLRPVGLTWQVLGSEFIMRRLGRIIQGLLILALAIYNLDIVWTVGKVFYLPIVFASTTLFFGGLFMVGATITFWTVESIEAINIFTYGGTEMMSYPMHIYHRWIQRFFTYVLPGIFIIYYPALYFLDKPDPLGLPWYAPFLSPVVGVGMLLVALGFWNFGLRHYKSTGT